MRVRINGKHMELDGEASILSLVELKGINPESVVVEYNHEIPKREKWAEITLREGDNIEIVKFMGGG
ncbi:sulfur carrier protein [Anaerobacterium chartisolvens]|uniref:Sulfur carrier protein n=1 Tax=Anaerobacterium chartisolvens TaxID=1297424 RepID=A0A369BI52_9FIRM|nr:sulfur carrier protein ThiS [Anaerobacterium chartisolvens]RCX20127.1 sulfur carrier protein [Anaerobacterium chartisolvens]